MDTSVRRILTHPLKSTQRGKRIGSCAIGNLGMVDSPATPQLLSPLFTGEFHGTSQNADQTCCLPRQSLSEGAAEERSRRHQAFEARRAAADSSTRSGISDEFHRR